MTTAVKITYVSGNQDVEVKVVGPSGEVHVLTEDGQESPTIYVYEGQTITVSEKDRG